MATSKVQYLGFSPVPAAQLQANFAKYTWSDEATAAFRLMTEPLGASKSEVEVLNEKEWPHWRFGWFWLGLNQNGRSRRRHVVLGYEVTYPRPGLVTLSDWLGWKPMQKRNPPSTVRMNLFRQLADQDDFEALLEMLEKFPGALQVALEPEPEWGMDVAAWVAEVVTLGRAIMQPPSRGGGSTAP